MKSPRQLLRDNDAAAIKAVRKEMQKIRIVLPEGGLKEKEDWSESYQSEDEIEELYETR